MPVKSFITFGLGRSMSLGYILQILFSEKYKIANSSVTIEARLNFT